MAYQLLWAIYCQKLFLLFVSEEFAGNFLNEQLELICLYIVKWDSYLTLIILFNINHWLLYTIKWFEISPLNTNNSSWNKR